MRNFLLIKKIIAVVFLCTFLTGVVFAETVDELNKKITDQKGKLEQLDAEIKKINADLLKTGAEKTTLQNTLKTLEASRKKLEKDINYTQGSISITNLNINKLALSISDKNQKIGEGRQAMQKSLRALSEIEEISPIEVFLSNQSMGDLWNYAQALVTVDHEIQGNVRELQGLARELEADKKETEAKKVELEKQKKLLGSQKQSVEVTKQEKTQVLKETQNKETVFQKQLADKKAQKEAFEKEILDIESKIKLLIDPNSYPRPKGGIISWPVSNIKITQLFGGTEFAKNNPGIYGRAYHPGVDFGVPIGTKVKSVSGGTVQAVGNTDAYPGCIAWGKWVLIKHKNGLSSLYAHLSSVIVNTGQSVLEGDVIALSGNTGATTGPHLHLTIYASQGVQVGKYSSYKAGTGCSATAATGPFADLDAYLNPISYLPSV